MYAIRSYYGLIVWAALFFNALDSRQLGGPIWAIWPPYVVFWVWPAVAGAGATASPQVVPPSVEAAKRTSMAAAAPSVGTTEQAR